MTPQEENTQRIMKLELAVVFLINILRGMDVPKNVLDQVERIVSSGGAQSG